MLDFRACRSQALRRARSAMVILRHPWPPPWFTAPRTDSSAHSARPIRWSTSRGVVPRSTRTSWSQHPFSGQANATVHPSSYPPPPTPCGPTGGSTAQVQRSGIPYFVSLFMSNYPGASTPCPTFPSQSFDNAMVVGPGFNPVPDKLVTAIASGLYVDLAALVSPPSDESSLPTMSFDGRLIIAPPPPPPGIPNRLQMSFNGPKRFPYSPSFSLPGSPIVLVTCFCTNC
jgi:hypothetical protein